MTGPYRTLDPELLRRDLVENAFAQRSARGELFGMWLECFPVRWDFTGTVPASVPLEGGVGEGGAAEPGLVALVDEFGARAGLGIVRPGELAAPDPERAQGRFSFEPGARLRYRSRLCSSPREVFDDVTSALDGVSQELAAHGVALVALGSDPWRAAEALEVTHVDPLHVCLDQVYRTAGDMGVAALRQTCGMGIEIEAGNPVQAQARWRAAQLAAPLFVALFSSSCFAGGVHTGYKGYRSRAWRLAEPTRTGFPRTFAASPKGDRAAQYLQFALEARVLLVRHPESWVPQTHPITFAQWMEFGIGGLFPDLDDWRFHLSTLQPTVRPSGMLELAACDSLPRQWWPVPLLFASVLFTRGGALERLLALVDARAGELGRRYEQAERDGLLDERLGAEAQSAFALAADELANAGESFASREMVAAFGAFGERCALRGRSPSDDLLDLFLERATLDRAGLEEYETACFAAMAERL